ncbi:MAG: hypothetical protein ACI9J3_002885 [Parvicellaceae bacterium]|jgi:hypothetical protein
MDESILKPFITLFDLTGKQIQVIVGQSKQGVSVNLSACVKGMYFLRVESEGNFQTKRVVVQ